MKNNIHILAALFAGAAMLLSSCEKQMTEGGNIAFTVDVNSYKLLTTKAAPIGDPANDPDTYLPLFQTRFGSTGFKVSAYNGTTARMTDATVAYRNEWTPNVDAQWFSGETLDFYAIAGSSDASGKGISNLAVNAAQKKMTFDYILQDFYPENQEEVMVAWYSGTGNADAQDDDKRIAPLTFHHALAAIRIKAGDIAEANLPISSFGMMPVYHKGSCTVDMANLGSNGAFAWTVDTDYRPVLPGAPTGFNTNIIGKEFSTSTPITDGQLIGGNQEFTFMVIPQTLSSESVLNIVIDSGKNSVSFSASLAGIELKPGKIYDITVNFKGITLETFDEQPIAMIVPWTVSPSIKEITDPLLMPVIAYLDKGSDFNQKLATLAGGADNITRIVFDRFGAVDETGTEVQDEDETRSNVKIYASYDAGVVTITTHANSIYANADCKGLFQNFSNLTGIDFGDFFSTVETTDMSYMFANCPSITSLNLIDVLDTGGVTNMTHMFDGLTSCTQLLLGNKFNTAAVTDMSYMFSNCRGITTLDLGLYFYTSNVTNMDHMFYYCSDLTGLDLKTHFDTSHVTNMNYMFYYCSMNRLHLNGGFTFAHNPAANYMFDRAFVNGAEVYLTVAARNWILAHPETHIGSVHYNTI